MNEKKIVPKEEQEKIQAEIKKNIIAYHKGFYSKEHASPREEHYLGSPKNRQMEQFFREKKQEQKFEPVPSGPRLVKK